jgi:hypothetical protein
LLSGSIHAIFIANCERILAIQILVKYQSISAEYIEEAEINQLLIAKSYASCISDEYCG